MRAYLRRVLFSLDIGIGQLLDGTYQVITAPIHALAREDTWTASTGS